MHTPAHRLPASPPSLSPNTLIRLFGGIKGHGKHRSGEVMDYNDLPSPHTPPSFYLFPPIDYEKHTDSTLLSMVIFSVFLPFFKYLYIAIFLYFNFYLPILLYFILLLPPPPLPPLFLLFLLFFFFPTTTTTTTLYIISSSHINKIKQTSIY